MSDKPLIFTPKPRSEMPEGSLVCHLKPMPVSMYVELQPNAQPTPIGTMMAVPCIKETCALWMSETSECSELSKNKALVGINLGLQELNASIVQMDGLMRMSDNSGN